MEKKRKLEVGGLNESGKQKKRRHQPPLHTSNHNAEEMSLVNPAQSGVDESGDSKKTVDQVPLDISNNAPQEISFFNPGASRDAESKDHKKTGNQAPLDTSSNCRQEISYFNPGATRLATPTTKKTVHGKDRFFCGYCPKSYPFKRKTDVHIVNHHPAMTVECAVCGHRFSEDASLTRHFPKCTVKAIYECTNCDEKLDSKSLLKEHAKDNGHTPKIFSCDYCPTQFNSFRELFQHLQVKHQEKNSYKNISEGNVEKVYKCSLCTYQTLHASNGENHYKLHHPEIAKRIMVALSNKPREAAMLLAKQEKSIQCHYCELMLREKSSMIRHVRLTHPDRTPNCPYCNYPCISLHSMRRHVKLAHKELMDDYYARVERTVDTGRKQRKYKIQPVNAPKRLKCVHCTFHTNSEKSLQVHMKSQHFHAPPMGQKYDMYSSNTKRNDNVPLTEVQTLTGTAPRKIPLNEEEEKNSDAELEDYVTTLIEGIDDTYVYSCYTMVSNDAKDVYVGTVIVQKDYSKPCQIWVKDEASDQYVRPHLKFPANRTKYWHYESALFTSPSSAIQEACGCSEFAAAYKVALLSVMSELLPNDVSCVTNGLTRRRGFYNTDVEGVKKRLFEDVMNGEDPLKVEVPLHFCGFYSTKTLLSTHRKFKKQMHSIPTNYDKLLHMKKNADCGLEDKVKVLIEKYFTIPMDTTSCSSYVMIRPNSSNPYFGTVWGCHNYPCKIWKPVEKGIYYVRIDKIIQEKFYLYGKMKIRAPVTEAYTPMLTAEFHSAFCHAVQSGIYVYTGEERVKPYNIQPKLLGFFGCDQEKLKLAILDAVKTGADPIRMKVPMDLCPYFSTSATCDWVLNADEPLESIGEIGEFRGVKCPTKYIEPLQLLTSGPFGVNQVAQFFGFEEDCFMTFLSRNNIEYFHKSPTRIPKTEAIEYLQQWEAGQMTFKQLMDNCCCSRTVLRSVYREEGCCRLDFKLSPEDLKEVMTQVFNLKVSSSQVATKYGIYKGTMDTYLRKEFGMSRDMVDERFRVGLCVRRSFACWKLKIPYDKVKDHQYLIQT